MNLMEYLELNDEYYYITLKSQELLHLVELLYINIVVALLQKEEIN